MDTKFLPLGISLGEETYGENLPVAVILRVDDALRRRVAEAVMLLREKNLDSLQFDLGWEDARAIRTLGYTNENFLAPIPGWMDDSHGQVRTPFLDDLMEFEVDGHEKEADYREDCLVYSRADEPLVKPCMLRLARTEPGSDSVSGVGLELCLTTQNWSLGTWIHGLDELSDLFPLQEQRVEAPRRLELTGEALKQTLFDWLCAKYVQRADDRQKLMGLQYTEAETHDLASGIANLVDGLTLVEGDAEQADRPARERG
jgi:hypothetical protein